ncbi:hypothetical protein GCM10007301_53580 [Azorhizobium oxalatiphilum]|uniref:Ancillary SecYEG translocon subunit/Cell division coordinator CpoB TPR domain-containing protein n=1 Tax=Azorhizobium oxalatiphilum TaxID=980631 RepID=A0A917CFL7_9HYPH|nr:tetratricopeptide repeat protein [Azorhizobium oxalatiphilum]GGF86982.1 hypothetical protein GCM10007301_53580 [Azorhizobium oxalatiphilum]
MTDIFHEIDEDLRRERYTRLWNRYGIYLIALVVLVIAGTGAYSGYRWWTLKQAHTASAKFEAAAKLSSDGKHQEAEAAFDALAKEAPAGYRTLARFRAASELAQRDAGAAVAAFDTLAADASLTTSERDLARIRAGLLLVDTGTVDAVKQRLQQVADGQGALRSAARELIALAQYKAGDLKAANATATAITEDQEAPGGVRSRAMLLKTLTAPVDATPSAASSSPAAPTPAAGSTATQ